jgi:hypothetical protein
MSLQVEKTHPGCRLRGFLSWDECEDLTELIRAVYINKIRENYPGINTLPNQYYGWVRKCGKERCSHCFEFSLDKEPSKIPTHLKRIVGELAKKGEKIGSARYCACYDLVSANWASAHHGYGPNLEGKIFVKIGSKEFPVSGRKLVPNPKLRRK